MLELHGRGIPAGLFDRMTGLGALADAQGFVLAMPEAIDETWNDGRDTARAGGMPDDVGFLRAVIDDVAAHAPVDRRRVYLAGMSNGATMIGRLACEAPDGLAAVAQVAGTVGADVAGRRPPIGPLPVLQVHGTADPYAPYAANAARSIRARLLFRRSLGATLDVEAWARMLVEANACAEPPEVERVAPDVAVRRWRGATGASDVEFYRVEGGGHAWPGAVHPLPRLLLGRGDRAFDATRTIWAFLSRHGLPG